MRATLRLTRSRDRDSWGLSIASQSCRTRRKLGLSLHPLGVYLLGCTTTILFNRDPMDKEYNSRVLVLGQPSNSELVVIYRSNDLKLIFNVAWQPL